MKGKTKDISRSHKREEFIDFGVVSCGGNNVMWFLQLGECPFKEIPSLCVTLGFVWRLFVFLICCLLLLIDSNNMNISRYGSGCSTLQDIVKTEELWKMFVTQGLLLTPNYWSTPPFFGKSLYLSLLLEVVKWSTSKPLNQIPILRWRFLRFRFVVRYFPNISRGIFS